MNIPRREWIALALTSGAFFTCKGEETQLKKIDVEYVFSPTDRVIEAGAPVPVKFFVKSLAGIPGYPNLLGCPGGLWWKVENESGEKVGERWWGKDGVITSTNPDEFPMWTRNEGAHFECDLAELYPLDRPGLYKFTAIWVGVPFHEFEIRVVEPKKVFELDAKGRGARVDTYPRYFTQSDAPIQCTLEQFAWEDEKDTLNVLRVRQYTIADATPMPIDLRYSALRVIAVKRAELDYKWQLWTLLQSGKEMALLIFNLRQGRIQTVIPWGEHTIEMKTTLASARIEDGKMVIAGFPNTVKITTNSVHDYVYNPEEWRRSKEVSEMERISPRRRGK